MLRLPPASSSVAARRSGLGWVLALLLLAGLFWSWGLAHASTGPAVDSELDYFQSMDAAYEPQAFESVDSAQAELSCRKPAPLKTTLADLVLNEIADKDVQSRHAGWWPPLPHAAPMPRALPELPLIEREPLLRPPAQLG